MRIMSKISSLMAAALFLSSCNTLVTRTAVKETEQRKQFQDQVSTLQRSSADINAKFSEIDAELRALNGRTDSIENKMQVEKNQESKAAPQVQVDELQRKVLLLEQELVSLKSKTEQLALSRADERSATPTKAKTKEVFDEAEEHFASKDFKKAILGYSKYREVYPKGRRFAEATYKIGLSFQELGQQDEASIFFEEVIAKFPNSSEARKAKARLKPRR